MTGPEKSAPDPEFPVRLDIWLDVACLYRTRSDAQQACRNGKIEVNGQTAKPNRLVRPGDELIVSRQFGRKQRFIIRGVAEKHMAKADARLLYMDLTPKPTAEQIEIRRIERMHRAAMTPPRAPDKRARRALREMNKKW